MLLELSPNDFRVLVKWKLYSSIRCSVFLWHQIEKVFLNVGTWKGDFLRKPESRVPVKVFFLIKSTWKSFRVVSELSFKSTLNVKKNRVALIVIWWYLLISNPSYQTNLLVVIKKRFKKITHVNVCAKISRSWKWIGEKMYGKIPLPDSCWHRLT